MKINNRMSQTDRCELFGCLIDVVEDWLETKGITVADIPNDEREDEDSAIIYGSDYDELANEFANVLGIDRDNDSEFSNKQKPVESLTAGLIRELVSDRNIPELRTLVANKQDEEHLDLINLDNYFACKLWSEEDIVGVLEEAGYEASEENVNAVINSGLLKNLNNCTDQDWDIINNAISEVMTAEQEKE